MTIRRSGENAYGPFPPFETPLSASRARLRGGDAPSLPLDDFLMVLVTPAAGALSEPPQVHDR